MLAVDVRLNQSELDPLSPPCSVGLKQGRAARPPRSPDFCLLVDAKETAADDLPMRRWTHNALVPIALGLIFLPLFVAF
jgi:hypothetical protein